MVSASFCRVSCSCCFLMVVFSFCRVSSCFSSVFISVVKLVMSVVCCVPSIRSQVGQCALGPSVCMLCFFVVILVISWLVWVICVRRRSVFFRSVSCCWVSVWFCFCAVVRLVGILVFFCCSFWYCVSWCVRCCMDCW